MVLVKFLFHFIYKSIAIESEVIKLIFLLFFCTYENTVKLYLQLACEDRFEALGELGKRIKQSGINKIALHKHVNNSLTNLPYFPANGLDHTDWFCAQIT
jgi:hypothetical protein